jgi:hypothetical protein
MDHVYAENNCHQAGCRGKTNAHDEIKVRAPPRNAVSFTELNQYAGVYFNNIEAIRFSSSMLPHPLQVCTQPATKAGHSASIAKGRPLTTPSLLHFKNPKVCLRESVIPPTPANQARKRKFLSRDSSTKTRDTHVIPDESSSRARKVTSDGQEAEHIVVELHSIDYRMSADEAMFVEAAAKLVSHPVEVRSDEGSGKHHDSPVLRTLNALPPPPFALPRLHKIDNILQAINI